MSNSSAVPAVQRAAPRVGRRGLTRAALAAAALGVLLTPARPADAQTAPRRQAPPQRTGWEVLFSSGALVPTGAQRDALKDAALSTAQVSYVVRSRFAITTMLG